MTTTSTTLNAATQDQPSPVLVMRDGEISVFRKGHHYWATFNWNGMNFQTDVWLQNSQAHAQAAAMLKSLEYRAARGVEFQAPKGRRTITPLLIAGSVEQMPVTTMRQIALGMRITHAGLMTREELIEKLQPLLEGTDSKELDWHG